MSGNNWATNISKKVATGQQKRDKKSIHNTKQKQALNKKKEGVNYFPIQNLLKIVSNKSSVVTCPVISPR
jgi:hypothetical protein